MWNIPELFSMRKISQNLDRFFFFFLQTLQLLWQTEYPAWTREEKNYLIFFGRRSDWNKKQEKKKKKKSCGRFFPGKKIFRVFEGKLGIYDPNKGSGLANIESKTQLSEHKMRQNSLKLQYWVLKMKNQPKNNSSLEKLVNNCNFQKNTW